MHTFLSTYCLDVMGIQIWRQSQIFPNLQQKSTFEVYNLYDTSNEYRGVLCLESLYISAQKEAAVSHLLDAMLAAVKLKRIPLLDNNISTEGALILLMGQSLAQEVLASKETLDVLRQGNLYTHESMAKILVTYHPLDLLNEPTQKLKAWEDLKKLL